MNITNKLGLPRALVAAVENDAYTGGGDISVTRLIQPPQISYLARGQDLEEDVSDRIWMLLGSCVHTILERAYEHDPRYPDLMKKDLLVERRLFTECNGWTVSGQLDVLEDGVLSDYKITSVYARAGKVEWEQQLNLLAHLCRINGYKVDKAQNVAIFRDWRPKEALKDDYPSTQVAIIPVTLWEPLIASQYMLDRVRAHQADPPPPCTDEERWLAPAKWALMKKGQKRAIRLFDIQPDNINLMPGQYFEHRPGAYRRCDDYCSVSRICPQNLETIAARRRSEGVGEQDDGAEPSTLEVADGHLPAG